MPRLRYIALRPKPTIPHLHASILARRTRSLIDDPVSAMCIVHALASQVDALLAVAATEDFDAGCVISQRGAPSGPSRLFVIIRGSVTVSRPSVEAAAGAGPDILGRLGMGEHFGAKNIVDPSAPREVDVAADVAVCCLTFTAEALGEALLPLIQHSLARELATRRWILENRGKVRMEHLEAIRTIGVGSFGR